MLFQCQRIQRKTLNYQHSCGKNKTHTPSSKAQRLLTSCSLWLNTSCRTSITLCRIFSISVTLYIKRHTQKRKKNTWSTPRTHIQYDMLHLMSKLLVLQPRIYITMSLPETRSLQRGEVCLHPAYQPLGAGSGVNGPRLILKVLGRVPDWMPT